MLSSSLRTVSPRNTERCRCRQRHQPVPLPAPGLFDVQGFQRQCEVLHFGDRGAVFHVPTLQNCAGTPPTCPRSGRDLPGGVLRPNELKTTKGTVSASVILTYHEGRSMGGVRGYCVGLAASGPHFFGRDSGGTSPF